MDVKKSIYLVNFVQAEIDILLTLLFSNLRFREIVKLQITDDNNKFDE